MVESQTRKESKYDFKVACNISSDGTQYAIIHRKAASLEPMLTVVREINTILCAVVADDQTIRNRYRRISCEYVDTVITQHDTVTGIRKQWEIWFAGPSRSW